MTRRLVLPVAALAAFAVAASPAAAKQVKLTKADSGKTVTVHKGDTIAISLASNETTGYSWKVGTTPSRKVARVTTDKYIAARRGSPPGSGGTQSYVIKAVGKGSTAFATTYTQVGSGNVGPKFAIKIRVKP
jgi:predicted secreted protein